jgi:small subunit ribosomal protein S20
MANSPQSKKRARQADRRLAVNKARRSRIRTFLKKGRRGDRVGRQIRSRDRSAHRTARADAWRDEGRLPQEHRFAENVASLLAGVNAIA